MPEIVGSGARDTIVGTAGADTLSGQDGSDSIAAGAGDDLVYGHSASDDAGITAVRVASGLSRPVFGVSPPGEPDKLFLVEQYTGRIRILDLNSGSVQSDPFLDLPNGVLATGTEQGLLGLAFHPNYQQNGLFYIYLTNTAGDTEVQAYVRQSPTKAGALTDVIMTIPRAGSPNHVGGWMGFGPDGYLYIASGDGHSSATGITLAAQDTDTLLGKILRIDVDRDDFPFDFMRNYAIPAGNPFAGATPGADEIWVYGLRNPWRPSFDSANGDLYIGDVGANAREEVDYVAAGQSGFNFGWPLKEGFLVRTADQTGLTDPILDYDRVTPLYRGFAVTGGYVYHGPGGAQGLYVFADYITGNLWTTRVVDGQAQDFLNRNGQITVQGGDLDQITSFAVDGRGRLYVIGQDGDVHRLDFGAAAGDGGDYLRGDEGNDTILGGAGFDDINGNMGDDSVSGGAGDDWVVGGKDQDWLSGDDGADIVLGNLGDDTCDGGAGADTVRGGQGDDLLFGGAGNDFISGDRGDDTATGGAGADIFNSFGDAGLDRITDFNRAEGDRIRLDPGSTYTVAQEGADTVVSITGGARVVLAGVQLSSLTGDWIFVG
ncbi:PQQ-dependent sugar dehydrogenase [Phenylobacterium sp.]|uniref:PQQ-dependent sugar dehydrogenase n=1 Tax=Phenylobacterium sp. TaxID=1871053 RepID=UPI0025F2516E|nr:PQQ-dependent sugar dehydrogenase [Phenylobacterium sp.]MBX3485283.1 PQQ-dependent sugar dehydrogenase [Phenylobacterium sp.]